MSITKSAIYTDSNGGQHPSHKAATKAQNVIDRKARLAAFQPDLVTFDRNDLATHAEQLLAALTLPSTRGPKKKVAAAA